MTSALHTWTTVLVAICMQATPFVVLGAVLGAALDGLPPGWPRRWVPRRTLLSVPLLGLAGTALPGCECGSVSTAAAMIGCGVDTGPATAFMLSAPAANPVVLAATAAAYPGRPAVVAARFVAGLLAAVAVGALAARGAVGRPQPRHPPHIHAAARGRAMRFVATTADDVLRSLGLLTLGAAGAAGAAVFLPPNFLAAIAHHPVVAVPTLAAFATILCICSQADAFVARSFAGFSITAQLAFMVVGAAVDLKTVTLQVGAFGSRFGFRCGALVAAVALPCACLVSAVLL